MEKNRQDDETKKIIITDENNEQHEGEILFSFEENGDQYIIYELNDKAFGAKINENNVLSPISDDEWPLVEKIYNQFLEEEQEFEKINDKES